MIQELQFENFKSFHLAKLPLAPLTVLIGPNASGKSNAIEAMELLSWIAEGRRLGDLLSSVREREISLRGALPRLTWTPSAETSFAFECTIAGTPDAPALRLRIVLSVTEKGLKILEERLKAPDLESVVPLYEVTEAAPEYGSELQVAYNNFARGHVKPRIACIDSQAVFTQLLTPARFGASHQKSQREIPAACRRLGDQLRSVLFLDPSPRLMREYSFTTEDRLKGDGSNISAVLHHLVYEENQEERLLRFIQSLPEQDITAVGFLETQRNEVMIKLTETFGNRKEDFDAPSLSDGTLRVLAVAAALLSVDEGSTVVIEEIDNGVHPSRAHLLLQNIQEVIEERRLRVLLTTHNPALLNALPDQALPDVVACYRDPEDGDSRLMRLEDLEAYPELVARESLGNLVAQGILDRMLKAKESREDMVQRNLQWVDTIQTS